MLVDRVDLLGAIESLVKAYREYVTFKDHSTIICLIRLSLSLVGMCWIVHCLACPCWFYLSKIKKMNWSQIFCELYYRDLNKSFDQIGGTHCADKLIRYWISCKHSSHLARLRHLRKYSNYLEILSLRQYDFSSNQRIGFRARRVITRITAQITFAKS